VGRKTPLGPHAGGGLVSDTRVNRPSAATICFDYFLESCFSITSVGSQGLNVVQSRARNWGAEHMKVQEQIKKYIASQPEPKRTDMQELHRLTLQVSPGCKLWFSDGKDSKNRTVSNPTIGYGFHTIKYADGKTREFFQIGVSGNKTGISVYLLGLKDKKYLAKTYGKKLGKASVTGYCIRFKALKDINIDTLEAAIRYGFAAQNEKS
jgi:hypothetical protein